MTSCALGAEISSVQAREALPWLLEQQSRPRIGGGCGDGSTGSVPVVWRDAPRRRRFCDACGSPLVAAVDAAEYKQVTVLFADVVRSMDIAAAVDMERLREIMTDWWSARRRWCAATARDVRVHRRRSDGAVRRPGGVGGSRFSGCLAALAIQEERTSWRPKCSAATAWRCGCGWA